MDNFHETVLVKEVVESLHITKSAKPGLPAGRYIDATLGNGGHSIEILELGGQVLGIDMDPEMIDLTKNRIGERHGFKAVQGNFKDIRRIAEENNWNPTAGVLFDLGVSNIHLKDLTRGFSFENGEAPLDMRLDTENQGVTACDLLNVLRNDQLEEMFKVTLEGGPARWLTSRVIEARDTSPFKSVGDLLDICRGIKTGKPGLNPATLPFLALRIAVNSELDNLKEGLIQAFDLLEIGGRLVVISFHSKEDEIVKDFIADKRKLGAANLVTFKPVVAGEEELQINRRARSAKMRVIVKI